VSNLDFDLVMIRSSCNLCTHTHPPTHTHKHTHRRAHAQTHTHLWSYDDTACSTL